MNRAHSIDDLRAMARRRLPNFCFEYIEGGAEDEATLRRNRDVFDEIAFLPRTLVTPARSAHGCRRRSNIGCIRIHFSPAGVHGVAAWNVHINSSHLRITGCD